MDIKEFLTKYKLYPEQIDSERVLSLYKIEIDKGLSKYNSIKECSIPMLPTYINRDINAINDKKYILIDAGGTNFRSAIGYFSNNEFKTEYLEKNCMPGVKEEVSNKEFFDVLASYTKRLLPYASDIGFCFSYQVKMHNDLDGELIAWAKEIKAKEVVGKKVGKELLKALNLNNSNISITNDTTAVLLGSFDKVKCDKYIGCIYGTGLNLCYEEDSKHILKINDYSEDTMIINTETGNANCFDRGEIDLELDRESSIPGEGIMEKMASGYYLPILIFKALNFAYNEGLLERRLSNGFIEMSDASLFLEKKQGPLHDELNDDDIVYQIIDNIIKRASKVAALTISAFAIKSNVKNIGIALEGTTVYKTPNLYNYLNNYLNEILSKYNIEYKLIDGRDLILKGALYSIMKKTI